MSFCLCVDVVGQVDKAVEITKKALADDMCVVIGLQSTSEQREGVVEGRRERARGMGGEGGKERERRLNAVDTLFD